MFELPTKTAVTLRHLNIRDETHGEETVPAIDLKFTLEAGNDILALFDPQLKESLYYSKAANAGQKLVDGVPLVLPNKRFPALQPLAWQLDQAGCKCVIDYGLDKASSIALVDCKVNNFRLDAKEGGSVEITFRVQTNVIPDGALDKLTKLLNRETQIVVKLPTPDAASSPFGSTDADEAAKAEQKAKPKKGQQEAGDIFAKEHATKE